MKLGLILSSLVLLLSLFMANKSFAHKLPPEVQAIVDEVASLEGDANRGARVALMNCTSCHGNKGIPPKSRQGHTPYIADQTPVYIAIQLASFKTDHRTYPMMNMIMDSISSQDIADLVAHFTSPDIQQAHCQDSPRGNQYPSPLNYAPREMVKLVKQIKKTEGSYEAGKVLASKKREFQRPDGSTVAVSCTMCHGEDGMMPAEYRDRTMHPDLAALGKDYIVLQMAAYKTEFRKGGPMKIMLDDLSVKDLADLATYYSKITHCK